MPSLQGGAAAVVAARRSPSFDHQVTLINRAITHLMSDSEIHRRIGPVKAEKVEKVEEVEEVDKLYYQSRVKAFYGTKNIQLFVAALILLNFVISGIQAQYLPVPGKDDLAISVFHYFEYFFAYAFTVELAVNFYGSYLWKFWKSWWNIFDFLIVVISLLSLYMKDLPGISVLRLFRAFRVVRLFKRIKTMRKMMDSIISSLPGMSIAFAALFLIMGIYGIIGVEFWQHSHPDYFGNFLKAVLSLLQIMTFDSWCSGIARDIIFEKGAVAAVFFITYVFIASIIMANVLIALLLDEFMNTNVGDEEQGIEGKEFLDDNSLVKSILEGVSGNHPCQQCGFPNKDSAALSLQYPSAFGQTPQMKLQLNKAKNHSSEMSQDELNVNGGAKRSANDSKHYTSSNLLSVANLEMQKLTSTSGIEQKTDDVEFTPCKSSGTRPYNRTETFGTNTSWPIDRAQWNSFIRLPIEEKTIKGVTGSSNESSARTALMQEWMSRVDKGVNILAQSLVDLNKKLEILSSSAANSPEEDLYFNGSSRDAMRNAGKSSNDSSVKLMKRSSRSPITAEHFTHHPGDVQPGETHCR